MPCRLYSSHVQEITQTVTPYSFEVRLDPRIAHSFVSVYPCTPTGEALPSLASVSGTVTIQVKTANCPYWQSPAVNSLNMATPDDISFDGNVEAIRATLSSGASGISWIRLSCSQNVS